MVIFLNQGVNQAIILQVLKLLLVKSDFTIIYTTQYMKIYSYINTSITKYLGNRYYYCSILIIFTNQSISSIISINKS